MKHERVEFMPINNKTTKKQLTDYAKKLERTLRAYRKGYYEDSDKTFIVRRYRFAPNTPNMNASTWNPMKYGDATAPIIVDAGSPVNAVQQFEASNRNKTMELKGDAHVGVIVSVGRYRELRQPSNWELRTTS